MYRSLAAILTIGVCVSGFLCLGQEVTPQEGQGESRLSAEAMATLAEFQKYAVAWEESRTGKRDRSTFDMRTFLALIKDVGERKMRQATPDLLHILNNADQEGSAAEYCMNALKEIRDERAIVPLLGEVHRSATHARTIVALEALVAFERPVGPQIVLALRGENDLRKRRGLWAVRLLARDRIDELVLVKLSAEERPWFEVSEALDEAVTALLRDKDPLVRFEALQTHLLLHDGVLGPARKLLSDEENASVKFLLAHPAVAEHLADHDIRSALRKESPKVVAPAPEAYRKVSAWVSLDRTRSLRVSMTSTNLRLTEPLYALNEAVWIRVELKNTGQEPIEVQTHAGTNLPLVRIAVHDSYGKTKLFGLSLERFHQKPGSVRLQPSGTLSWECNLIDHFGFELDGEYKIRCDAEADSPELLAFSVTGLPQPLWHAFYHPFGYDLKRLYYQRFDVPAGPALYAEIKEPRPPQDRLYLRHATPVQDRTGHLHFYYEKRVWSNTEQRWQYESPLNPRALRHFDSYHECVRTVGGRLTKWIYYEGGRLHQSIEYNDRGKLTLHVHYDRHGDPHHAGGATYTDTGQFATRVQYRGPAMKVERAYRYTYNDEDQRIKEERCDAHGILTDYFIIHPERRGEGREVWYERYSANGEGSGEGWLIPD